VYRAWDPELEREVAIKILHPHVADRTLKQRLLQEGRALAKVRHPNVVNVLGVEAHEERVGLCMEFVYGETLDAVVRTHGVLNAREAVGIAEDLCQALSAVHRAGFIHRDIKAKNVMREREGRIVLMDFGTGRSVDRPEIQGDVAGTPLYMAPEVLAGEPASVCSDVYSLGVLIYHLVTAAYPVEARSLDEIRDAHARNQRSLLSERRPDLPVSFIRVVSTALAPDPRDRCPTAAALLEALGTIHAGADTKVDHRRRVAVVAALPVVAVCGLAALGALTSAAFNI
jgi:serine/threonine protein kinase